MSILKYGPTILVRTVIIPSGLSPIRILREQWRVDSHEMVSDDGDHGENSEGVSQGVQCIVCDHLHGEE